MALFGHAAAWWEAKFDRHVQEGRPDPGTWARWAKQSGREIGRAIRDKAKLRGVDPDNLSPLDIGMPFHPATGVTTGRGFEAGS